MTSQTSQTSGLHATPPTGRAAAGGPAPHIAQRVLRSEPAFERLPLPRFLLRHLVQGNQLRVGTRLLVVGHGAPALADFFTYLGLRARAGECVVDADARSAERLGLQLQGTDAPLADASVDCLLVTDAFAMTAKSDLRPLVSHRAAGPCRTPDVRPLVAACLACLVPQGSLVILEHAGAESTGTPRHTLECLSGQLEPLPGRTTRESVGSGAAWRRWLPRALSRGPVRVIRHELPGEWPGPWPGAPQWLEAMRDSDAQCRCGDAAVESISSAA